LIAKTLVTNEDELHDIREQTSSQNEERGNISLHMEESSRYHACKLVKDVKIVNNTRRIQGETIWM